jgi:hypothetical protein
LSNFIEKRQNTNKNGQFHSETVQNLAAPQGLEPRHTDPKSAVLPLDEGAMAERSLSEPDQPVKGNRCYMVLLSEFCHEPFIICSSKSGTKPYIFCPVSMTV